MKHLLHLNPPRAFLLSGIPEHGTSCSQPGFAHQKFQSASARPSLVPAIKRHSPQVHPVLCRYHLPADIQGSLSPSIMQPFPYKHAHPSLPDSCIRSPAPPQDSPYSLIKIKFCGQKRESCVSHAGYC